VTVPVPVETCDRCRFDGADYNLADALGTLRALPVMWAWAVEGVAEDLLAARPAPGVWSATEYTAHSADVTEVMGRLLHGLRTVDDLEVEAVPESHAPDASAGFVAALERLGANLARLHRGAERLGPPRDPAWQRTATIGGEEVVDGAWVLRHAVHDCSHHLMDVGRGLHALGAGPATHMGSVVQLNVSDGGVPKLPVPQLDVSGRGATGDRQAARQHHGRPFQALCLWSLEVIDGLRAEGHSVGPGLAGENVTVQGIDWAALRPGVRLRVGEVLAEVSAWASPCKKNAGWFVDRDFNRMDHGRHPGWSRAYAWVREPGAICPGDPVVVEP
jgi:MOSC domain-containing protein YiiM